MLARGGIPQIAALLLASFTFSFRLNDENRQQITDDGVKNKTFGLATEKLFGLNSASSRPLRELLTMMHVVSTESSLEAHAIRHGRHRGRHRQPAGSVRNSSIPLQTSVNGSFAVSMVALDSHANCYNSNEVLEIILVTCLVNFTFWSLILTCVHLHTRTQLIHKTDSSESLLPSEDSQISTTSNPLRLPTSMERLLESGDLSEDGRTNHWQKSVRGRHLSQLLTDLISLDNLQLTRWQPETKTKSLSMENLLF